MNSAINTIDQRQESQQNEAQEESKEGMFIRMAEAAKILGVSYPTAREILKKNNITKYVLTPRIIYYKRSEVEQIFTNNGISIWILLKYSKREARAILRFSTRISRFFKAQEVG